MSSLPTRYDLTDDGLRSGLAELPASLRSQLAEFRKHIRTTKLVEVVAVCLIVGLCAFSTVLIADRFWNTHQFILVALFFMASAVWLLLPLALFRWVWESRRWEQVARILRRQNHGLGDELLSAIELSSSPMEQSRSPGLCQAALLQVAQRAASQDLRASAPRHRLRLLSVLGLGLAFLVSTFAVFSPAAASNAWSRLSWPWNPAERFTYASLATLPDKLVVPHGESTNVTVGLLPQSTYQPDFARLAFRSSSNADRPPMEAKLSRPNRIGTDSQAVSQPDALRGESTEPFYQFTVPPLTSPQLMHVSAGDYSQEFTIEPLLRPELTTLSAKITLPDYLQIAQALEQDIRAGMLSVVAGSSIQLKANASRELQAAFIDGEMTEVSGTGFEFNHLDVGKESRELQLDWQDRHGLTGRHPFQLQIQVFPDELPSIAAQDLPKQAVLLESEQINFKVLAADDFGVKQVGLAWKALDQPLVARPAQGQRVIAGGGSSLPALQVPATFCASALGITPQPIEVTVWVQDYSPEHPPIHSAPHQFYILTPDEHAIWITSQINRWHRSALEVRDTELQLFQANRKLKDEFGLQPDNPRMIESMRRQAALEAANGRKLNSLTQSGADLLRQASRNPDLAAESLDKMAGMLEVLRDISENRMPSVADLLKNAAESLSEPGPKGGPDSSQLSSSTDTTSSSQDSPSGMQQVTDGSDSNPSNSAISGNTPTDAGSAATDSPPGDTSDSGKQKQASPFSPPSVSDIESNLHSPDALDSTRSDSQQPESSPPASAGLPQTTLLGPNGTSANTPTGEESSPPAPGQLAEDQPLSRAVREQLELLAEFEKIADQMNSILGNLEGSTLVKRLKAASREQSQVAEKIASRIESIFGKSQAIPEEDRAILETLSKSQQESSQTLSFIMDDMQAYFDRRKIPQIKSVLDEMKTSEVLLSLKKLGDDLLEEHGLSIAQAEYWADTIDRWAEDIVETPEGENDNSSSESKDALPPKFVLEMLRILEGEVNLREDTRVLQNTEKVVSPTELQAATDRLSRAQSDLRKRTDELSQEISALPNAEQSFSQEILLFSTVSQIMEEARFLLSVGNVGSQTIAAETEAIELLLQSNRVNPQGGGGGGSSPGGGGTGSTEDSALALLGAGINSKERLESRETGQGVGKATDRVFPEEYRGGLDAYFELLESRTTSSN